jgi:hypothetical protein
MINLDTFQYILGFLSLNLKFNFEFVKSFSPYTRKDLYFIGKTDGFTNKVYPFIAVDLMIFL